MVKITNKNQFEQLVQIMEQNEDIARGFIKSGKDFKIDLKSRWEKISQKLNSLGPPTRDADGWVKVWTDLKFKIKKKKTHNNVERRATGGGPNKLYSFSQLEERVANLINMNIAINPPGQEFGCSSISNIQDSTDESEVNNRSSNSEWNLVLQEVENMMDSPLVEEPPVVQQSPTPQHNKKKKKVFQTDRQGKRIQLLEKQTETQEQLYKGLTTALQEIKENTTESLHIRKKMYYLKKDKMKLAKENLQLKKETLSLRKQIFKEKQLHTREKLKLKAQILELQKRQLDIQQFSE